MAPPVSSLRAFLLCGSQLLTGHLEGQAPWGAMALACVVCHPGLPDPGLARFFSTEMHRAATLPRSRKVQV